MDTPTKTVWITVAGGIVVALISASVTLLNNKSDSSKPESPISTTTINQALESGSISTTHTGSGDINMDLATPQKPAK